MGNIPTKDILSLVMKQKYQTKYNTTTYIRYSLLSSEELKTLFAKMGYIFIPHMDIYILCPYKNNFNVMTEGEFFVKAANYDSSIDLMIGKSLAKEDDIRFQLYHNSSYAVSCNNFKQVYQLLNLSAEQFYQSFVLDGIAFNELYHIKRPDLPSIKELAVKYLNKASLILGDIQIQHNEVIINNFLEKTFTANSNIVFEKVKNHADANLLLFQLEVATEILNYSNSDVINYLAAGLPIINLTNSSEAFPWNEFMHGVAHIFLDHPCENGFYACNKEFIKKNNPDIFMLTALSEILTSTINSIANESYNIQSLLPWDLAALRHIYGMPRSVNMTYKLADSAQLNEVFGWPLVNNSLVAFSLVGNISIDASDVRSYAIDLRYDHLSKVVHGDLSIKFLLSYDTEISRIIVNQSGSIELSDAFKTDIMLLNGCYEVVLHEENDSILHFGDEGCLNESIIDVYTHGSSAKIFMSDALNYHI